MSGDAEGPTEKVPTLRDRVAAIHGQMHTRRVALEDERENWYLTIYWLQLNGLRLGEWVETLKSYPRPWAHLRWPKLANRAGKGFRKLVRKHPRFRQLESERDALALQWKRRQNPTQWGFWILMAVLFLVLLFIMFLVLSIRR